MDFLAAGEGPNGRFDPAQYYFWGIWDFAKNIPAAKSLLAHLATRDIQQLVMASSGFNIPPAAPDRHANVGASDDDEDDRAAHAGGAPSE